MDVETIDLTDPLEQLCKQYGLSPELALEKLELLKQGRNIDLPDKIILTDNSNNKLQDNETIDLLSDEEEDNSNKSVEAVNVNLVQDNVDNGDWRESNDITEVKIIQCYSDGQESSEGEDDDLFEEETFNQAGYNDGPPVLVKFVDIEEKPDEIETKEIDSTLESSFKNVHSDKSIILDKLTLKATHKTVFKKSQRVLSSVVVEQSKLDKIEKEESENIEKGLESNKLDDAITEQILDYEDQLIAVVDRVLTEATEDQPKKTTIAGDMKKDDQGQTEKIQMPHNTEDVDIKQNSEQKIIHQQGQEDSSMALTTTQNTDFETDSLSDNLSIGDDSENNDLIQNIIDHLNSDDAMSTENFEIDDPAEHQPNLDKNDDRNGSLKSMEEKVNIKKKLNFSEKENIARDQLQTESDSSNTSTEETTNVTEKTTKRNIGKQSFESDDSDSISHKSFGNCATNILDDSNNDKSKSLSSERLQDVTDRSIQLDNSNDITMSEMNKYTDQANTSQIQVTEKFNDTNEGVKSLDLESASAIENVKDDIVQELEAMLALDIDTSYERSRQTSKSTVCLKMLGLESGGEIKNSLGQISKLPNENIDKDTEMLKENKWDIKSKEPILVNQTNYGNTKTDNFSVNYNLSTNDNNITVREVDTLLYNKIEDVKLLNFVACAMENTDTELNSEHYVDSATDIDGNEPINNLYQVDPINKVEKEQSTLVEDNQENNEATFPKEIDMYETKIKMLDNKLDQKILEEKNASFEDEKNYMVFKYSCNDHSLIEEKDINDLNKDNLNNISFTEINGDENAKPTCPTKVDYKDIEKKMLNKADNNKIINNLIGKNIYTDKLAVDQSNTRAFDQSPEISKEVDRFNNINSFLEIHKPTSSTLLDQEDFENTSSINTEFKDVLNTVQGADRKRTYFIKPNQVDKKCKDLANHIKTKYLEISKSPSFQQAINANQTSNTFEKKFGDTLVDKDKENSKLVLVKNTYMNKSPNDSNPNISLSVKRVKEDSDETDLHKNNTFILVSGSTSQTQVVDQDKKINEMGVEDIHSDKSPVDDNNPNTYSNDIPIKKIKESDKTDLSKTNTIAVISRPVSPVVELLVEDIYNDTSSVNYSDLNENLNKLSRKEIIEGLNETDLSEKKNLTSVTSTPTLPTQVVDQDTKLNPFFVKEIYNTKSAVNDSDSNKNLNKISFKEITKGLDENDLSKNNLFIHQDKKIKVDVENNKLLINDNNPDKNLNEILLRKINEGNDKPNSSRRNSFSLKSRPTSQTQGFGQEKKIDEVVVNYMYSEKPSVNDSNLNGVSLKETREGSDIADLSESNSSTSPIQVIYECVEKKAIDKNSEKLVSNLTDDENGKIKDLDYNTDKSPVGEKNIEDNINNILLKQEEKEKSESSLSKNYMFLEMRKPASPTEAEKEFITKTIVEDTDFKGILNSVDVNNEKINDQLAKNTHAVQTLAIEKVLNHAKSDDLCKKEKSPEINKPSSLTLVGDVKDVFIKVSYNDQSIIVEENKSNSYQEDNNIMPTEPTSSTQVVDNNIKKLSITKTEPTDVLNVLNDKDKTVLFVKETYTKNSLAIVTEIRPTEINNETNDIDLSKNKRSPTQVDNKDKESKYILNALDEKVKHRIVEATYTDQSLVIELDKNQTDVGEIMAVEINKESGASSDLRKDYDSHEITKATSPTQVVEKKKDFNQENSSILETFSPENKDKIVQDLIVEGTYTGQRINIDNNQTQPKSNKIKINNEEKKIRDLVADCTDCTDQSQVVKIDQNRKEEITTTEINIEYNTDLCKDHDVPEIIQPKSSMQVDSKDDKITIDSGSNLSETKESPELGKLTIPLQLDAEDIQRVTIDKEFNYLENTKDKKARNNDQSHVIESIMNNPENSIEILPTAINKETDCIKLISSTQKDNGITEILIVNDKDLKDADDQCASNLTKNYELTKETSSKNGKPVITSLALNDSETKSENVVTKPCKYVSDGPAAKEFLSDLAEASNIELVVYGDEKNIDIQEKVDKNLSDLPGVKEFLVDLAKANNIELIEDEDSNSLDASESDMIIETLDDNEVDEVERGLCQDNKSLGHEIELNKSQSSALEENSKNLCKTSNLKEVFSDIVKSTDTDKDDTSGIVNDNSKSAKEIAVQNHSKQINLFVRENQKFKQILDKDEVAEKGNYPKRLKMTDLMLKRLNNTVETESNTDNTFLIDKKNLDNMARAVFDPNEIRIVSLSESLISKKTEELKLNKEKESELPRVLEEEHKNNELVVKSCTLESSACSEVVKNIEDKEINALEHNNKCDDQLRSDKFSKDEYEDEPQSDEEFKVPQDQEEVRKNLLLQLSCLRSRKNTGLMGISLIPNSTYEKYSISKSYENRMQLTEKYNRSSNSQNTKDTNDEVTLESLKRDQEETHNMELDENKKDIAEENSEIKKNAESKIEQNKLTEEIKSILNDEMRASSRAGSHQSGSNHPSDFGDCNSNFSEGHDDSSNSRDQNQHGIKKTLSNTKTSGVFEIVKNKLKKVDTKGPRKTLKVKYTEEIAGPSWLDRPFRYVSNNDVHYSSVTEDRESDFLETNDASIYNQSTDFGFVIQSVTSISEVENNYDQSNFVNNESESNNSQNHTNEKDKENQQNNLISELRNIISTSRNPKNKKPLISEVEQKSVETLQRNFVTPLETKGTPKNSNPFESNALDEFLTENSELHVSYDVPKSGAEEGLRLNYAEEDLLMPVYVKEDTNEDYPEKPRGEPKIKARTLAEKRRLYEKNQRKLAKEQEKAKKLQQNQKKCYVLFEDRQIYVKSHLTSKCIAEINSTRRIDRKLDKGTKHEGPRKLAPTTRRKQSLLRELFERNKPNFKFKAGPLSKKPHLQTNIGSWVTELKELPKVFLEIEAHFGRPVHPDILRLMPQSDGEVTDSQVEFALSALKTKKDESKKDESKKQLYGFIVPYKNNQTQILVRRRQKIAIFAKDAEPKDVKFTIEEEVAGVVNDLINYVELKEIAPSLIKEDEDGNYLQEEMKGEHNLANLLDENHLMVKKVRRKKCTKTNAELRRLNCKVVEVELDQPQEDGTICEKPYCKLGCVCKCLSGEGFIGLHCGKLKCMFGCSCPKVNDKIHTFSQIKMPPGTDLFSTDTVSRIEDEAKRYLAKVERDFTQTIIQTGDKTIVVGFGSKPRRATRAPKKYIDYIDEDPEDYHSHKRRSSHLEVLKSQMKPCSVEIEKFNFSNIMPYCLVHNLYNCYCKGRFKFINPEAPDENYVTTEKTVPVATAKKEKKNDKKKNKIEQKQKTIPVESPSTEKSEESNDDNDVSYSVTGRPIRHRKRKKTKAEQDKKLKEKPQEDEAAYINPDNLQSEVLESARTKPISKKYKKLKKVEDELFKWDFIRNITQADLLKINLEKDALSDSELLKITIIAEERRRLNELEDAASEDLAKKHNKRKQVLEMRDEDRIILKKAKTSDGTPHPSKPKVKSVFEGEIIVDDENWLDRFARNTRQQMDGYARILPWKAMLKGFLSRKLTVNCLLEMPYRLVLTLGIKSLPKALNVEKDAEVILNTKFVTKNPWCAGQTENVRDIVKWLTDCSLPEKYNETSLSFLLVEIEENQFEIRGLCTQTAKQSSRTTSDTSGSQPSTSRASGRRSSTSTFDPSKPSTSYGFTRPSSSSSTSSAREVPAQIVVSDDESVDEQPPEDDPKEPLPEIPLNGSIQIVKHRDGKGKIRQMFLTRERYALQELVEGSATSSSNIDVTNELYMWVSLPQIFKVGKWKMMPLNRDFAYLHFVNVSYSIKYIDLIKFTEIAKNSKCTLVLKNKELSATYAHTHFGIYVDQNYADRIFIGPYFRNFLREDVETLEYVNERLISTQTVHHMKGHTDYKYGHWLIERSTLGPSCKISMQGTIDLTEEDDTEIIYKNPIQHKTDQSKGTTPNKTRSKTKKDQRIKNAKTAIPENTATTTVDITQSPVTPTTTVDITQSPITTVDITQSPVNTTVSSTSASANNVSVDLTSEEDQILYHKGVPINIKNSTPKAPSEYNRFIITNIPSFGYLGAYQPEKSDVLEVSWPFEKKVLQFTSTEHARDFLKERFNQLLQPVPESFTIDVLILKEINFEKYEPVNSDFLSGHCICGPFGIFNFRELTDSFCRQVLGMTKQHITMLFARRAQSYIKRKIEELAEIVHLSNKDMVQLGVDGILEKAVTEIKYQENLRVSLMTDIEKQENVAVENMKKLYNLMSDLPAWERNNQCRVFQDILKIRPTRTVSNDIVEIPDDDDDPDDDNDVSVVTPTLQNKCRTGSIILPNTLPEDDSVDGTDTFVTPTITHVTSLAQDVIDAQNEDTSATAKRTIDQLDSAKEPSNQFSLLIKKRKYVIDEDPQCEKTALQKTLPALKPMQRTTFTQPNTLVNTSIKNNSSNHLTVFSTISTHQEDRTVIFKTSDSNAENNYPHTVWAENETENIVYAFDTPTSTHTTSSDQHSRVGSIILPNTLPCEDEDEMSVDQGKNLNTPQSQPIVIKVQPPDEPIHYTIQKFSNAASSVIKLGSIVTTPSTSLQSSVLLPRQQKVLNSIVTKPAATASESQKFSSVPQISKPRTVSGLPSNTAVPNVPKSHILGGPPTNTAVLKALPKAVILQAGPALPVPKAKTSATQGIKVMRTSDGKFVMVSDHLTNPPPMQTTVTNLVIKDNQIVSSETFIEPS